jgi:hypothetical protein
MITRTQSAIQAPNNYSSLSEQLLTAAICAGALRAAIDQPLPQGERQALAEQLERVEAMRHTLENQVRPFERTRISWWRRLFW